MSDFESDPRGSSPSLTDDEVIGLLASETRRAAIAALQTEPQRSLEELADAVVADLGMDDIERVRHRLHHRHLPRLADAGVLQYDGEALVVEYSKNESLETALSALDR